MDSGAPAAQPPLDEYVGGTLRLLELEHAAELEEAEAWRETLSDSALEKKGVLVRKLRVAERRSGLAGRTLLVLESCVPAAKGFPRALPANELSSGDVVQLRDARIGGAAGGTGSGSEPMLSGLLYRPTATTLTVALEGDAATQDLAEPLAVIKLVDETTHKRLRLGLKALESGTLPMSAGQTGGTFVPAPGTGIRDVAFGVVPPRVLPIPPRENDAARLTNEEVSALETRMKADAGLNAGQEDAIDFAMRSSALACIHGPPGTGKTTTVVELIRRLVLLGGAKVLACAPSNVATDNLVERLAASGDQSSATPKDKGKGKARKQKGGGDVSQAVRPLRIVRAGHPSRLLPSVLVHSLDAVVQTGDEKALAKDVRAELDALLSSQVKGGWAKKRAEIKTLRKELKQREDAATMEAIRGADVVLCTCVGAVSWALKAAPEFDVVVIDEAAQTLEAACWLPLLRGKRAILAGDHMQLPPIVKSSAAAVGGYGRTLFDRLAEMHGESVVRMLTTQYRMNAKISDWASEQMYESRLIPGDGIGGRLLCDLPGVEDVELTNAAFLLIDTAGCIDCEETADEGGSKLNTGEVTLVAEYLEELLAYRTALSGFGVADIGVIAPYNAQVAALRDQLGEHCEAGLEISTVDGFQGREKEVIILSMTRSNTANEIGFLREDRRTNVAVTRARRQCVVIADSETIGSHPFLATLLDHCSQKGIHRSAAEYGMGGGSGGRSESAAAADAASTTPVKAKNRQQPSQKPPLLDVEVTRARFKPKLVECMELDDDIVAGAGCKWVTFPAMLNSFERNIIHELAEELGLAHESVGEGAERYIRCARVRDSSEAAEPEPEPEREPEPEPEPELDPGFEPEPKPESESSPEMDTLMEWSIKYGKQTLRIIAPADIGRIKDEIFAATGIECQQQKLIAKGHQATAAADLMAAVGKSGSGKLLLMATGASSGPSSAKHQRPQSAPTPKTRAPVQSLSSISTKGKPATETSASPNSMTPRFSPELKKKLTQKPKVAVAAPASVPSPAAAPALAVAAKEADDQEELTAAEKKHTKRQRQKAAKQVIADKAAEAEAAKAAKHDVDSVLASLGLSTKPGCCAFGASEGKQCPTKVGVVGQICEHCKLKFCIAHAHAQKHGCAEASREKGRNEFLTGPAAGGRGGATEKDREGLRRSLANKVDSSAEQRQRKAKPSGGGGGKKKKKK